MNLELICDEHTVHAFAQRQSSYVSRHSGRTLKRLEVTFGALNDEQKKWAEAIAASRRIIETNGGAGKKQWRIGHNEYMVTNDAPGAQFTWELLETETLEVAALIIDGWELKPYKYHEEFEHGDVLEIIARVELTEEEVERFRGLPRYFLVIRKGLSEHPREMRFGQCLWSQSDERYRVGLRLIDKKFDETSHFFGFNEPRQSNDAARTIRTSMVLRRLLDSLLAKELLSQVEVEQMEALDAKQVDRETWKRDRVNDLDKWLDKEGN